MRKKNKALKIRNDILLNDIHLAKRALDIAYSKFENASDPDLIDCYIYELNSVQYRYKYLMKQAKEFQLTSMF